LAEIEKLAKPISSLAITKDQQQFQQGPQPPYQPLCMQQALQQFILQNQAQGTPQFDLIPTSVYPSELSFPLSLKRT
jgi:hypothetical protein